MEFQTLLETRRSVRSYLPGGKPDAETIKKLIAAAQEAPSWKNTETGRYHYVLSDNMIAKFQETCLPPFNATRTTNAAYLVATYVRDVSGYNVHEKTPENEAGNGWGCYDLGLQTENLLLKATELGYSTLIMGIRDADAIRKLLSIPEEENIMAVIAVGKAAEAPFRPKRKAVEDVLTIC